MLLRFEVSNYRSILDPVELSMIAVDEDRAAARGFEQLSERVLTVAGIYGPNASGKSSVLEALAWLSYAIGASLRSWSDFVPRLPHLFGDGPDQPSTFEVDFEVAGVRHGYRLEVIYKGVLYESLYSYPERRRRTLFEREGDDISFRRGLTGVAGIQQLLTPTTLALSAAKRLGISVIGAAGNALSWMHALGPRKRGATLFLPPEHDPLSEVLAGQFEDWTTESGPDLAIRDAYVALLRFADPEIDDVVILRDDDPEPSDPRRRLRFVRNDAGEQVHFEIGPGVGGHAGVVQPAGAGVRSPPARPGHAVRRDRRQPPPSAVDPAHRTVPGPADQPAQRATHLHHSRHVAPERPEP